MKPNVTPRNTNRIPSNNNMECNHNKNKTDNIRVSNYSKSEFPKKKIVKYGNDKLIIPLPDESDGSAYDAIIRPNGMNGTERFFSVPKDAEDTACALQKYLEKLRGKNVCATIWTNGKSKIEKCGVLTDVGTDYISIKENHSKRLIIINMDNVKYISVFCV